MKKKPTTYLNYTIVAWVFGLAALVLESVAISLFLAKWNGPTWVNYVLGSLGFVFLGVSLAMVIVINTTNHKSIKEDEYYTEVEDDKK